MGPVYRSTEGSTTCSGVCDACTDGWTQDVSMLGSREDVGYGGSEDPRCLKTRGSEMPYPGDTGIATDRTGARESNRDREWRNGRWCNGPAGTG